MLVKQVHSWRDYAQLQCRSVGKYGSVKLYWLTSSSCCQFHCCDVVGAVFTHD